MKICPWTTSFECFPMAFGEYKKAGTIVELEKRDFIYPDDSAKHLRIDDDLRRIAHDIWACGTEHSNSRWSKTKGCKNCGSLECYFGQLPGICETAPRQVSLNGDLPEKSQLAEPENEEWNISADTDARCALSEHSLWGNLFCLWL